MDLSTIKKKIDAGDYKSKEKIQEDLMLIFKNAKHYNQKTTVYYKYAVELEEYAKRLLSNLKLELSDEELNLLLKKNGK